MLGRRAREEAPQLLFGPPEVGRLTTESGAVHLSECGEQLGVVATEVGEEARVGIDAEELTYHLDGEDLRVREFGGRATFAQAPLILEPIVN